MELIHLQMFVAAAEEQSLQKAAQRVNRTPQAVSTAIRTLEKELATNLFDRPAGRGLRCSAGGEALFGYAKRVLDLLSEGREAVEAVCMVKRGHLCIGATQSLGDCLLPHLLQIFREKFPAIKLKTSAGYTDAMLAALRLRDIDVALVFGRPRSEDSKSELVMKDRLVALINPRHELASQRVLSLEMLGKENLVLFADCSELRERVVVALGRSNIQLYPAKENVALESVKRMVVQNKGIGIIPRFYVRNERSQSFLVKTIARFVDDRDIWLAYPKVASPACEAFVSLVKLELGQTK